MVAEQLCLEEAVFRRKTVRGNVFARNVGNGTKPKGSMQTSSPRWAGSWNALVQSSVWVRLKEGTDLCCATSPRAMLKPCVRGWSLPTSHGAWALQPAVAMPQPSAHRERLPELSRHSQLPWALWFPARYLHQGSDSPWVQPRASQLGRCYVPLSQIPKSSCGELHQVGSTSCSSFSVSLQQWYCRAGSLFTQQISVVCGLLCEGSWWEGELHRDSTELGRSSAACRSECHGL